MQKSFDVKAALLSIVVGTILVVGLAAWTGRDLGAPVLPFLAMLSGFIVTGFIVGLLSKHETIAEPGIASLAVGVISYIIITSMKLHCFDHLPADAYKVNMLLVLLNGVVLTFAGAWAGEKLQGTYDNGTDAGGNIEWGWVIAGTIIGITASMLLTNVIVQLFGAYLSYLAIALVIGLFLTGYFVGLRSPGITIREAGIAGFLTTVIVFNVFKITLDPDTTQLSLGEVVFGVILGLFAAYVGGFLGEKQQASNEA